MQKVKNFFSSLLSHLFLAGLCVLFIISSCKKDEKDDDSVKEEVSTEISSEDSIFYVTNEVMQTYYLWNDQLPTDLDIYSYENPNDLMEAMRYDQYDHWSTVLDASYFESVLETGASYSIGFRLRWNSDNTLRVVNVYKGSVITSYSIHYTKLYEYTRPLRRDQTVEIQYIPNCHHSELH